MSPKRDTYEGSGVDRSSFPFGRNKEGFYAEPYALVQALKILKSRGDYVVASGRASAAPNSDVQLRRSRWPEDYSTTRSPPDGRPHIRGSREMKWPASGPSGGREPLRFSAEEHTPRDDLGFRVQRQGPGRAARRGGSRVASKASVDAAPSEASGAERS